MLLSRVLSKTQQGKVDLEMREYSIITNISIPGYKNIVNKYLEYAETDSKYKGAVLQTSEVDGGYLCLKLSLSDDFSEEKAIVSDFEGLKAAVGFFPLQWVSGTFRIESVKRTIIAYLKSLLGVNISKVVVSDESKANLRLFTPLGGNDLPVYLNSSVYLNCVNGINLHEWEEFTAYGDPLATLAVGRLNPSILFQELDHRINNSILMIPRSDTAFQKLEGRNLTKWNRNAHPQTVVNQNTENIPDEETVDQLIAKLREEEWRHHHTHPILGIVMCPKCRNLRDMAKLWPLVIERAGKSVYCCISQGLSSQTRANWRFQDDWLESLESGLIRGDPVKINIQAPAIDIDHLLYAAISAFMQMITVHPSSPVLFSDTGLEGLEDSIFDSLKVIENNVIRISLVSYFQLETFLVVLHEKSRIEAQIVAFADFSTFEEAVLYRSVLTGSKDASQIVPLILDKFDFPILQIEIEEKRYRLIAEKDTINLRITPSSARGGSHHDMMKMVAVELQHTIENAIEFFEFCLNEEPYNSFRMIKSMYKKKGATLEILKLLITLYPTINHGFTVCMNRNSQGIQGSERSSGPLSFEIPAIDRPIIDFLKSPFVYKLGWSGFFSHGGLKGLVEWSPTVLRDSASSLGIHLHIEKKLQPVGFFGNLDIDPNVQEEVMLVRIGTEVLLALELHPDSVFNPKSKIQLVDNLIKVWELGLMFDPWAAAFYSRTKKVASFTNFRYFVARLGLKSLYLNSTEAETFSIALEKMLR